MGRNCETVDEFDIKLKENGAEMPDYFVRTLLTIIHAILPPKQRSKSEKGSKEGDDEPFSALKIKDGRERVKEIEEAKSRRRLEGPDEEDRYKNRDRDGDRRDRRHDIDRDRNRNRDRDWEKERDRERERVKHGDREDRGGHMGREERGADGYRDGYDDERGRQRHSNSDRNQGGERNWRNEYDEERDYDNRETRKGKDSQSDEPELYNVYKGRVSRVMDKGCFVQFHDFRGKEGLVYVSQMATRRISNAKDIVKRDQEVFVKVISVSGNNVSLSMRDVDQNSGKDLLPLKRSETDDGMMANPSGRNDGGGMGSRIGLSGIRITEEVEAVPSRRPLKKMSSPERWEAKQLIASGVMSVKDYPMLDDEGDGMLYQEEGGEEELEVELNDDEPAFLQGQSRYSIDMSPVKIFKNPEGSLSRAAALQSALIKERREVREQQQRTMLDSIPKDLNPLGKTQCQKQVRGILLRN